MKISFSNTAPQVHIWKYRINDLEHKNIQSDGRQNILPQLSIEEQNRAGRFINEEDRQRYLSVHLFLHNVLSQYTDHDAGELEFIHGHNDKPFLKDGQNDHPPFFNLSYRENYALLAVSNTFEVGVDVEKIHDIDNICLFACNFFSTEEQQAIFSKGKEEEQLASLFTFWTMKEAVIKSLGIGFMMPFTTYNLSPFLTTPHGFPDFDKQHKWYIKRVAVNDGYKAALALKADEADLKVFDYEKN